MPQHFTQPSIPGFVNPKDLFADTSASSDPPAKATAADFLYEAQATASKLAYLLNCLKQHVGSRELSLALTKMQELKFWLDQHEHPLDAPVNPIVTPSSIRSSSEAVANEEDDPDGEEIQPPS